MLPAISTPVPIERHSATPASDMATSTISAMNRTTPFCLWMDVMVGSSGAVLRSGTDLRTPQHVAQGNHGFVDAVTVVAPVVGRIRRTAAAGAAVEIGDH